jgi:hypothetical protein
MAVIQEPRRRLGGLEPSVLEQVEALARRRGVSPHDLVNAALAQFVDDPEVRVELETAPQQTPLPPAAARTYEQLVRMWTGLGPVRSQALAEAMGLHRGNVDRHLATMRELGYARRDRHGHVPIVAADAQEAQLAS